MSLTVAKPATTPIPVQLSETECSRLSYRTSRCPSIGRSAHWAITMSVTSLCGSCRRACHGSAYAYRKTPRASRSFTTDHLQSLCHMGRRWVTVAAVCGSCAASRGREAPRSSRAPWRRDQHRDQKGGDRIGESGYKTRRARRSLLSSILIALC